MVDKPPSKVLLATTAATGKQITPLLSGLTELVAAHTFDDAVERLGEARPDLVIVGYHFDELRPFRFIQYVKEDPARADLPVLLVLALPLHADNPPDVAAMKAAYSAVGVADVISLRDLEREHGRARAMQIFQQTVLSALRARA